MSDVAQAATEEVLGDEQEAELSTAEPQATEEIELKDDEEVKTPSEEPKKKSGFARRAEKFQREKDELAAERDYWRQLALESNKAAPVQAKSEPRLEDFESVADFIAARDEWLEERVVTKVLGTVKSTVKKDKVLEAHEARVQAVKKELTDWDDVFDEAGDMQVPPDTAQFVLESDVGPKIAYHLAKNPSELERLSKLSPTRRLAELGKLEDRLATKAAPAPKKVSAAPAKLAEVKGGTDALPAGRPTSFAEWKANRDRQNKR